MPRTAKYSPEQITSIYEQNVSRSFKEATRRKLTRRSLSLITNINNSIRDNIRTILREGVAEGKSVSAIASSLMTTGLDKGIFASARKRAYLIAKTELHRARQKGAIDIYKANKINRVRWVAISDGRVCERCLGRNNRTYLIRELTEEDFPPIHPRCRCRLLPDNFQVSIKVKQTAAGKVMETKVYPSPQNYKYIIKVKKSLEDLDKGFFSKFTHKYLSKKGTQGHFFDYKYPEFKRPGKPGKPEKPKKPLPSVYGKVYNMSLDLQLKNSNKTAIFEKEFNHEDFSLNGISFKSVPTPDFKTIVDKPVDPPFDVGEVPNLPFHHQSSGVIIEEPDGRVWVVEPSHHFGGYKQTFPKGTVEKGYTTQQTALKEAFEESGLHVEITGFLGDYLKTTSVTRYYLAKRVGGDPAKASWETARVRLAPFSELPKLLNRMVDKRILLDYLKSKMISKGLDVGEVKRKIKDYFDNVTKGQLSKDLEECGLEKGKRVFVPASGKRKAYTRFDPRNKKEILYHGTYGKFERFLPPDEVPEESQTYGQHEIGIYTSESEEFARTFGDRVVKVAKPKKTLDLRGAKTL